MVEEKDSAVLKALVFNLAKIFIALGILGVIIWYTPIIELFLNFGYLVLIPVVFLCAIGLISNQTIDFVTISSQELRKRIFNEREKLQAASQ